MFLQDFANQMVQKQGRNIKYVGEGLLFCFTQCTSQNKLKTFSKQKFLLAADKPLPCQHHGYLMFEENVILNNFQHLMCISVGVYCNFADTSGVINEIPHYKYR